MKIDALAEMTRGWFVGNFTPTAYKTDNVEVAVKKYQAGDCEKWHYHKIATEITVIVSGEVAMNGQLFKAGSMITLSPGEGTDFLAITDAVTTVVKIPCVPNDKYSREK